MNKTFKLFPLTFLSVFLTEPTFSQENKRCLEGKSADNYKYWEYIVNNAHRTADEYATERNPNAVFIFGKVEPIYQVAGEYKGNYLVKIVSESNLGISFIMMKPNFNFCANPETLDDKKSDLFSVVIAKFNGVPF